MDVMSWEPFWLLILLLPIAVAIRYSLVDRPRRFWIGSMALRGLAVVFLILSLCGPVWRTQTANMHVCFLVDVSESVDLDSCLQALNEVKQKMESLASGDTASCFLLASHLRSGNPDELQKMIADWQKNTPDARFRRNTNLSGGLRACRLQFPAGVVQQVVVYSDGRDTTGELSSALAQLRAEGIGVYRKPLQSLKEKEVAVLSCSPSVPTAFQGERIRLRAKVVSNCDQKAQVVFVHQDVVQVEMQVELKAGVSQDVDYETTAQTSGRCLWSAQIRAEGDHFPLNNSLSCAIEVAGRPRVLAIHQKPAAMRAFSRALKKQEIDCDVRPPSGLPLTLEQMLTFDAIILADVAATDLSTDQLSDLRRYVADYGGALVMFGSNNSFGLGGYYQTPVEEVLPLVSRYEKKKEIASLALALVIDKSGSMSGDKIAMARSAASAAVDMLGEQDKVCVIAFDSQPVEVVPITSAALRASVKSRISSLEAGGGTDMYPAMEYAARQLRSSGAQVKHMIILGDGQSQPGDYEQLVAELAWDKGTVSTVALGAGADQNLLQTIAMIGKGRFYATDDPSLVPRIFTKETANAAKSGVREEPFLPVVVTDDPMGGALTFDDVPPLLGYVMTRAKPTAKMILVAESGEPLMAVGRFGLGRSLAFTSDATEAWGAEWTEWDQFGKFWSHALRAIIRKKTGEGIQMLDENLQDWYVQRVDEAFNPVGEIQWQTRLITENGAELKPDVHECGTGLYRIKRPEGSSREQGMTLSLFDPDREGLRIIHEPGQYPQEFRLDAQAAPSFLSLSEYGDGQDEQVNVQSSNRLDNLFVVLALICMIGGIFLRRV